MADEESLDPHMNPEQAHSASDLPAADDLAAREELDAELAAIETALARMHPLPSDMDRDELMFLAGRQDALRLNRRWFWPAATMLSTALAASLAVMLLLANGTLRVRDAQIADPPQQSAAEVMVGKLPVPAGASMLRQPREPTPEQAPMVVATPRSTEPQYATTTNYLQQRSQAISQGVKTLPRPSTTSIASPTAPVGYGAMRDEIFGRAVKKPARRFDSEPEPFSPLDLLPF